MNGEISNVVFKNYETSESLSNRHLKDKLQDIPKWQPGVYLGEIVRTSISYEVPLRLFEKYPR
jgi:hypothetical protein